MTYLKTFSFYFGSVYSNTAKIILIVWVNQTAGNWVYGVSSFIYRLFCGNVFRKTRQQSISRNEIKGKPGNAKGVCSLLNFLLWKNRAPRFTSRSRIYASSYFLWRKIRGSRSENGSSDHSSGVFLFLYAYTSTSWYYFFFQLRRVPRRASNSPGEFIG